MSALILPHRRTRQPHRLVGIDQSSSLTRGLKSVLVPGLGYDPVIRGMADYTNVGGFAKTLAQGKALGFNVSSRSNNGLECNFHNTVFRDKGTMLIWWLPANVTDSSQYVMGMASSTNRFYLRNNAGAFEYGWGTTASRSTTASWALNKPSVAALSWLDAYGWAYFDGKLVGSAFSTVAAELNTASAIGVSPLYLHLTSLSARGYAILAALWDRPLHPAEHLALARNPWQLLAPTRSKLWVVPAAQTGDDRTGSAVFTAEAAVSGSGKKEALVAGSFTAVSAVQAMGVREGGAITASTAQAGNWSSPSTWIGGIVPGSGTYALINHNVTLDTDRTVGDGADAFLIGNDATLTLAAKLTCNGKATVGLDTGGSGTSWVGNLHFGPGSELALGGFDLRLNVCRLSSSATASNWAKVTGTGTSKIMTGSYVNPRQDMNVDYVSFQNTGSITFAIAQYPTTAGVTSRMRFNHCVFANPNSLQFGTAGATYSETPVDIRWCDFRNNTSITFSGASSDTRLPLFEYNTVHSSTQREGFLTLIYRHTSFKGSVYIADLLTYGGFAKLDGVFFAHPIGLNTGPRFATATSAADGQTIRNVFGYTDDTIDNCHGFSYPSGGGIEDSFFEIYGLEPNLFAWKAGATIRGNILKGRGVLASNAFDLTTALTMTIENNTVHLQARDPDYTHKGMWLTENANAGYVGTVNIRNNLCGFETEHDVEVYVSNRGTSSTAVLTNVEKNAYYNNLKTGLDMFKAITVTNHDDLGTVTPAYLDSGRGLRPWVDMMLGQARGTATDEDAFNYMLSANGYDQITKTQNLSLVPANFAILGSQNALIDWCRAGFSPTNNALKGTGIGGADIGAMPVSTGGTSSSSVTFTSASALGAAGRKAARGVGGFNITTAMGVSGVKHALSYAYGEGQAWGDESTPWDESETWDESAPWGGEGGVLSFLLHATALGINGEKNAFGEIADSYLSAIGADGTRNALVPGVFAHRVNLALFSSKDTTLRQGAAIFALTSGLGFDGAKNASGDFDAGHFADFEAGGIAIMRIAYGAAFFSHTHMLGAGGRKIFSYSQIQEADVAKVTQGERVPVKFYQGESVERNIFFFMPDGVTPISDLSQYSARMELREYPDDPNPIMVLTSETMDIFLSDTGLITWEIPGSESAEFQAQLFAGDLFIYAPDGDSIMVCGFDFEMNLTTTRRA